MPWNESTKMKDLLLKMEILYKTINIKDNTAKNSIDFKIPSQLKH
jgi:hypothetical protein